MFSTTPGARALLLTLFPALADFGRAAVRLHPRPGSPEPRESSVGGPLLWPAGEAWPTCGETHAAPKPKARPAASGNDFLLSKQRALRARVARLEGLGDLVSADILAGARAAAAEADADVATAGAVPTGTTVTPEAEPVADGPVVMAPVLQLFKRDAPRLDFPEGSDLLQILWCPEHHRDRIDRCPRAFWRSADAIGELLKSPPPLNRGHHERFVPRPCAVHPEEVIEYPPVCIAEDDKLFGLLPAALETRIKEWDQEQPEELDYFTLAHAPGWKAGGWEASAPESDALRPCGCGAPMRPLLETYVNEELNGTWSPNGTPDFAWGDPERWQDQEPTGVEIARNGATWIRICTANPRHPLDHGLL